jgi:hypothetical protein
MVHTLGEPQHEVAPLHMLRDIEEVFDESCHWLLTTNTEESLRQECPSADSSSVPSTNSAAVIEDIMEVTPHQI